MAPVRTGLLLPSFYRKKPESRHRTCMSALPAPSFIEAERTMEFKLHSDYQPTGDQPQAIEKLVKGFREGNQFQTLVGVTGSGKTFTMANVIEKLQKPTLIISHNKTLAAQLYSEMKEFFPENAVEYFVSYYDYYQPEAYVPSTDTYIEKDSAINDEIDKLRNSATSALLERKDVIVVASVSCIYGLGSPVDYKEMMVSLRPGQEKDRDEVISGLIDIQYTRNDMDFHRGTFRVRGDVLEIFPADQDKVAYRVEFFGDEIDRITEIDVLTGDVVAEVMHISVYPASHYVVPKEKIVTTNLWSAELTKLAANAMLAQRVSSVNALSALCEATGADITEVTRVIGLDSRIGPKFLKAGPGFGGSCFKKDVLNLVYLCETYGLKQAADYWNQVIEMNEWQQERIVTRLLSETFQTVANKRVAVFGYAFKADTGDIRETPSRHVVGMLVEERAKVVVTDPKALPNAERDLADMPEGSVSLEPCPYAAAKDADAIILMTDWKEYVRLDWRKIRRLMRSPALVYDTRNCLDLAKLEKLGFKVLAVGR